MRFWFHCLVLITPFVFTAINDELFEFNKMMFVYGVTIAVVLTWAIWSIRQGKILWRNHPLLPFMGLFLLSQTLSTVFSIHPGTSFYGYYSRFHGGLLSTLAYLALMQISISTLRATDIRPLIRSTLIGLIGVSLYAIPEHFGFSPSCLIILNEVGVGCWVQDVQTRVFATFGQPNWLAAYLVLLLPLAGWYGLTWANSAPSKKTWLHKLDQLLPFMALILGSTALSFTKSRSGDLGLIVGLLVFVVLVGIATWLRRQKNAFILNHVRVAALVLSMAVPLFLFGIWQWSGVESWAGARSQRASAPSAALQTGTQLENGGTDSGKIRLIVWQGALDIWKRYPVLGSGVETFAYAYYQDRPREHNDISEWDFLYNKAHNEFLNFLATSGLLGLASYLLLLGWGAWQFLKVALNPKVSWILTLAGGAWAAGIAAVSVTNALGFSTVMVGLLLFLLLAWWEILASAENAFPNGKKQERTEIELTAWESLNTKQWLLTLGCCSLALLAGIQVIQTWRNDHLLALSKAALATNDAQLAFSSSVQLTQNAPQEPLFWEQRSMVMARLAVGLSAEDSTTAAQLALDADQSSQQMLALNNRHINFWKSRVRVLLLLGTFEDKYLEEAIVVLKTARQLAPTDSKLTMNLALLYETLGQNSLAQEWYQTTLELRPNYEEARQRLAELQQAPPATASGQPKP